MNPIFQNPDYISLDIDLRTEQAIEWIHSSWIAEHPEQEWVILTIANTFLDEAVLQRFEKHAECLEDYRYIGDSPIETNRYPVVYGWDFEGELHQRTGAFIYHFEQSEGSRQDILVMSFYTGDHNSSTNLACVPRNFMPIWGRFAMKCNKYRNSRNRVSIIGGNQREYDPRVNWDDIILPEGLKRDIFEDVENFFSRGVAVYERLGLNPFRKILLAGVPGTGKTMICNALAKWALGQDYTVFYISGGDARGANFFKIQQALSTAENSDTPALIILEEIDAFLHQQQKAMVLNVLDGVESFENKHGTLLISTTNYPEAIDKRVLKRPGRLDRIYIVPPVKDEVLAEAMLRQYLGDMWQEEHRTMVAKLVDYPGAFIREVAVYALTRAVTNEETLLPLSLLRDSFERLKIQIKARDELIANSVNGRQNEIGFARRAELD
jgi:DNA replication protein DnaC